MAERKRARARSPERREQEMISLAEELAERKIRDGTASSQIIVHYLRLGTTRERLEKERIIEDTKLRRAKTESLDLAKRIEELYNDAIKSFGSYSGVFRKQEDDEYYED